MDFLVCAFSDLASVVDVYMDLSWISDEYEVLYQVRVLLVVLLSLVFVELGVVLMIGTRKCKVLINPEKFRLLLMDCSLVGV